MAIRAPDGANKQTVHIEQTGQMCLTDITNRIGRTDRKTMTFKLDFPGYL